MILYHTSIDISPDKGPQIRRHEPQDANWLQGAAAFFGLVFRLRQVEMLHYMGRLDGRNKIILEGSGFLRSGPKISGSQGFSTNC